jgi:drug/metabolite transporter (DMT)-like permease
VVGLLRGRRRLTARTGASLFLVCVALVLLGLAGDDERYPHLVLGLALSFVSAVLLAVFITLVSRAANDVPPTAAAGVQMALSGLLLSPALLALADRTEAIGRLALVAVFAFAPACTLYWLALRRLTPITAGTILLAEPCFGTAAAFLLYGTPLIAPHAVAAALVLAATYLDLSTKDG